MAFAVVVARLAVALIPLNFTVSSHKAWRALAVVTSQPFLACCSILALTVTVTDVDVTVLSRPSPKTVAVISANQIFARISVHTGLPCTLIRIYLAGLSFPLRGTHTLEAVLQINTGSTLGTRAGGTFIQIVGTGRTLPAWWTLALETCENLVACTSVGAGIGNTGMLGYLTGFSRVAQWTGAVIFIWFCVHAGSSIDTWLMATTVVQIFITQQATPVPLTVALPGYVAGPVDTSRIKNTFIAELALPAVFTLAFSWDSAASM